MYKFSALILGLLAGQWPALADVQVGQPAPNFTVNDIQNKTLQLSDLKGKIVVVENYNLDCPFVANHYRKGAMQKLQADATKKGVVWLVVNSSYKNADRLRQEVAKEDIQAASAVYDPNGLIGKRYGFKTTPHMLVIDKSGVLVYDGAIDDQADPDHDPAKARNYVREAITQLTEGHPPATSQTKPYGCGAKYAK